MSTFVFTSRNAESMKGGMLMKSKHIVTYGKEIANSNFGCYHLFDNFRYKFKITASAKTVILDYNCFVGIASEVRLFLL